MQMLLAIVMLLLCLLANSRQVTLSHQDHPKRGRRRSRPEGARRVQIAWLLPIQMETLRAIGRGDLSAGVRTLADLAARAKTDLDGALNQVRGLLGNNTGEVRPYVTEAGEIYNGAAPSVPPDTKVEPGDAL